MRSGKRKNPTITRKAVEAAVNSLRYTTGNTREAHSLRYLCLIDEMLLSPDRPHADSEEFREYLLLRLLADTISKEYCHDRLVNHLAPPSLDDTMEDAIRFIQEDAQKNSPELLAWSYLYFFYLRPELSINQELFGHYVSMTTRVIRRYKDDALTSLTQKLLQWEWEARQRLRVTRLQALVPLHTLFVGREAEKALIQRLIEREPRSYSEIIGSQGVGKSAFLAQVAQELLETVDYDYVAWLEAPQSIESLIAELRALLLPVRSDLELSAVLANHPTLILIDDLAHPITASPQWRTFKAQVQHASLICVLSQPTYEGLVIHLQDLSLEELSALMQRMYEDAGIPLEYLESDVPAIWEKVGGNPTAIYRCIRNLKQGVFDDFHESAVNQLYQALYQELSTEARLAWQILALTERETVLKDLWQFCQRYSPASAIEELHQHLLVQQGRLSKSARTFVQQAPVLIDDVFLKTLPLSSAYLWLWEEILACQWLELGDASYLGILKTVFPLAKGAGRWHQWQKIFTAYQALVQADWELSLAAALCLRELGHYAESEAQFQALISTSGKTGDFTAQQHALFELALLYRYRGDYERATALLGRLASFRYAPDKLHLELAQIALDREDAKATLAHLGQIQAPTTTSQILLAEAYYLAGESQIALKAATSSLEVVSSEADLATLYNLMGRIQHQLGNLDAAIDHINAALVLTEKQARQFYVARLQTNLAALLIEANELDEAESLLRIALKNQAQLGDKIGYKTSEHNLRILQVKR